MKKTVKITGVGHTVKKVGKKVIVDHAGSGKKWDKIDLTKKAGAKTVKQGIAASRKYHKSAPHRKG